MTKSIKTAHDSNNLLSIFLYILAGLVLITSIITLFSAFSVRPSLEASLMILIAAFGPLSNSIISILIGGVQNALFILSGIIFLISVLLFAASRLSARSRHLAQRVSDLEVQIHDMAAGHRRSDL